MWNWSFGDSNWYNSTTSSSPMHLYSAPGTYDVSLTVTNATGSNTMTHTGYIVVSSGGSGLPTAGFTGAPLNGTAPLTVTFTDNSTVVGGTMWNWSFGDTIWTNTTSRSNPIHTYMTPGIYDVSLTVTNATGNDTAIRNNYITVTPEDPGYQPPGSRAPPPTALPRSMSPSRIPRMYSTEPCGTGVRG